jgi:hypothetical protein
MDLSLKKEFDALVEKHMPKAMGEMLAKRIQELEVKETKLIKLEQDHKDLNEQYGKLVALNYEKKRLDDFKESLRLKELTLDDKERKMDLTLANQKADAAEARSTEMFGLVQMVFKSPIYRKNISTFSNPVFGPDGSVATGGKSGFEEKSEE